MLKALVLALSKILIKAREKTILERLGCARVFINQTFPRFSLTFIYAEKNHADPSRSNIVFPLVVNSSFLNVEKMDGML